MDKCNVSIFVERGILVMVVYDDPFILVVSQSFCPEIVTVFMSAFKSTDRVLEGESDNGNQN